MSRRALYVKCRYNGSVQFKICHGDNFESYCPQIIADLACVSLRTTGLQGICMSFAVIVSDADVFISLISFIIQALIKISTCGAASEGRGGGIKVHDNWSFCATMHIADTNGSSVPHLTGIIRALGFIWKSFES